MSQTKHLFEGENTKTFYLFVTTRVCLIHSVNKSFMFNISYFVIVLLMLCVRKKIFFHEDTESTLNINFVPRIGKI